MKGRSAGNALKVVHFPGIPKIFNFSHFSTRVHVCFVALKDGGSETAADAERLGRSAERAELSDLLICARFAFVLALQPLFLFGLSGQTLCRRALHMSHV
jgi:hypothetical protein